MNVLEAKHIGNLRLRLVEIPAAYPDLASSHYLISEYVGHDDIAAIAEVGYDPEQARATLTYYMHRELARIAAAQDDGT